MRKKLVESSLGIKTTEAVARKLDGILRELPKECSFRRKSVVAADPEIGERTDISYITTAANDRDNEIVIPSGIVLDDYRANPIVLYGHDQNKPIGKCLWVKTDERGLVAKTQYAARPTKYQGEWLPDFIFSMVQADVLRGKSIGFLPLEIRDPSSEELAVYPDAQRVISRSLLLEYSVVSVPSNPAALVDSIGKGIGLDFWNFKVVGKVRKAAPVITKIAKRPEPIRLDADRISEAVVKSLQARWEV